MVLQACFLHPLMHAADTHAPRAEDLGFRLCQALAKRGQMRRLAPGTKRIYEEHPLSNIWTVGAPYILLYYIVMKYLQAGLVERAYFSLNPLDVWPFIWCAFLCHNRLLVPFASPSHVAWQPMLTSMHALCLQDGDGVPRRMVLRSAPDLPQREHLLLSPHLLRGSMLLPVQSCTPADVHRMQPGLGPLTAIGWQRQVQAHPARNLHVLRPIQVKPLFKRVHSQHHQIGSAITTLGTAFGDAADIGLCFVAFHLVLGAYLYTRPAWNVAAVVLLIIFEARWAVPSLAARKGAAMSAVHLFRGPRQPPHPPCMQPCCSAAHQHVSSTGVGLSGLDERQGA